MLSPTRRLRWDTSRSKTILRLWGVRVNGREECWRPEKPCVSWVDRELIIQRLPGRARLMCSKRMRSPPTTSGAPATTRSQRSSRGDRRQMRQSIRQGAKVANPHRTPGQQLSKEPRASPGVSPTKDSWRTVWVAGSVVAVGGDVAGGSLATRSTVTTSRLEAW